MPVKREPLGPGLLKVGETGTEIDFSCQLSSCTVAWSDDTEDATPVLCGDEAPGETTWSATISGSALTDLSDDGITEFTWDNKGTQQPVVFVPNAVSGKAVTGTVTVKPLDVGGDVKATMTSDFEWDFVGEPQLGPAPQAELDAIGAHSQSHAMSSDLGGQDELVEA